MWAGLGLGQVGLWAGLLYKGVLYIANILGLLSHISCVFMGFDILGELILKPSMTFDEVQLGWEIIRAMSGLNMSSYRAI